MIASICVHVQHQTIKHPNPVWKWTKGKKECRRDFERMPGRGRRERAQSWSEWRASTGGRVGRCGTGRWYCGGKRLHKGEDEEEVSSAPKREFRKNVELSGRSGWMLLLHQQWFCPTCSSPLLLVQLHPAPQYQQHIHNVRGGRMFSSWGVKKLRRGLLHPFVGLMECSGSLSGSNSLYFTILWYFTCSGLC